MPGPGPIRASDVDAGRLGYSSTARPTYGTPSGSRLSSHPTTHSMPMHNHLGEFGTTSFSEYGTDRQLIIFPSKMSCKAYQSVVGSI